MKKSSNWTMDAIARNMGKTEQQPTEKVKALPRASTEPQTASASMDEQRECFMADLVERLYKVGEAKQVGDKTVEVVRGKNTFTIIVQIK